MEFIIIGLVMILLSKIFLYAEGRGYPKGSYITEERMDGPEEPRFDDYMFRKY